LKIAQNLGANMLALRVVLSLSRLWHVQGRDEKGTPLLAGIVGKFKEGFSTADLMEARQLLSRVQK
jgi:predicted ATPase